MGIVAARTKSWREVAAVVLTAAVFIGASLSSSGSALSEPVRKNMTQSKFSSLLSGAGKTRREFQIADASGEHHIATSAASDHVAGHKDHHHGHAEPHHHHHDGGHHHDGDHHHHDHAHGSAIDIDWVERVSELEDWTVEGVNAPSGSIKGILPAGTIIHFWASWCGPCEEEFPDLQSFYDEHIEGSDSLNLVTITNDSGQPPAKRFIEKHKTTFPVYLDPEQRTNLSILGRRELPSTVIVDADGRFHRLALGKLEWSYPKLPEVLASVAGKRAADRKNAGNNQE